MLQQKSQHNTQHYQRYKWNVYITDKMEWTSVVFGSADQKISVEAVFCLMDTWKQSATHCCLLPVHNSLRSCSCLAAVCCCINETVSGFKNQSSLRLHLLRWPRLVELSALEHRGTAPPILNNFFPMVACLFTFVDSSVYSVTLCLWVSEAAKVWACICVACYTRTVFTASDQTVWGF